MGAELHPAGPPSSRPSFPARARPLPRLRPRACIQQRAHESRAPPLLDGQADGEEQTLFLGRRWLSGPNLPAGCFDICGNGPPLGHGDKAACQVRYSRTALKPHTPPAQVKRQKSRQGGCQPRAELCPALTSCRRHPSFAVSCRAVPCCALWQLGGAKYQMRSDSSVWCGHVLHHATQSWQHGHDIVCPPPRVRSGA